VVAVMKSFQTIDEKIEYSKRPESPGYPNVRTIYPNHRLRNRRICRRSLGVSLPAPTHIAECATDAKNR